MMTPVPLSEDEQRILSEIEQRLYESDPHLAREVGSATVYSKASRSLRFGAVAFLAGLALLVLTLTTSHWLAFVGFLIMLKAAITMVNSARSIGRFGMAQLTNTLRTGSSRGQTPADDD
jgi:type IV secretory pathway TrbD component